MPCARYWPGRSRPGQCPRSSETCRSRSFIRSSSMKSAAGNRQRRPTRAGRRWRSRSGDNRTRRVAGGSEGILRSASDTARSPDGPRFVDRAVDRHQHCAIEERPKRQGWAFTFFDPQSGQPNLVSRIANRTFLRPLGSSGTSRRRLRGSLCRTSGSQR